MTSTIPGRKAIRDCGPTVQKSRPDLWTDSPYFEPHTLKIDIAALPRGTGAEWLVVECGATSGRAVEKRIIEIEAVTTVPAVDMLVSELENGKRKKDWKNTHPPPNEMKPSSHSAT
jgi:hypothetical protein